MKKLWIVAAFILGSAVVQSAAAQEAGPLKKAGNDIKKAAKKTGNKTAEITSKGAAKATDEIYKGKAGPEGQTIYIDNHSRYYWVDKKGKRNYVLESELKEKLD